jgi:EAL domain-containing protein (putative c-di-GMP-specific phosphodiesterase class I)
VTSKLNFFSTECPVVQTAGLLPRCLKPAYQPIFCRDTSSLFAHEALLRLHCQSNLSINTGEVIARWEKDGYIHMADVAMAMSVGRDVAASERIERITINVSLYSVEHALESYFTAVRPLLDLAEVIIEVTETWPIDDIENLSRFFSQAREMGFLLALDDAHPGHVYGEAKMLNMLKPNIVKIDGAFMKKVLADTTLRYSLIDLVKIAHDMGAEVVSEWIENADLLDLALSSGTDYLQGNMLGMPESVFQTSCLAEQRLPRPMHISPHFASELAANKI